MIQLVSEDQLDFSPQERAYFDTQFDDPDDPSKRHRIPIRAWNGTQFVKAFFYEPLDNLTTALFAELTPLYLKSQVLPFCSCDVHYHRLLLAKHALEAATTSLCVTQEYLISLKDRVSKTVWKKLKDLHGQTFFSPYEAADAIMDILQGVLSESQIEEVGGIILDSLPILGIHDELRQQRLTDIQTQIDTFYGHAPTKPFPPSEDRCPHCHSPYRYSLLELIVTQPKILDRLKRILIGEFEIPFADLTRILEALEVWLFHHHDADLFAKKKTMTGMLMSSFHQGYQTMMAQMTLQLIEPDPSVNADGSTASVGTSGTSPPPPPAPDLPDGS